MEVAAIRASATCAGALELAGFAKRATAPKPGGSSQTSSSRLPPSAAVTKLTPVALVPGRFMLWTSPSGTGSSPITKTIGVVELAAFAAKAELLPPTAAMNATRREVLGKHRQPVIAAFRPAVFYREVSAGDVAGFGERAEESSRMGCRLVGCSA